MGLNGKTYEMQYLTDEETAVINAMRMGAEGERNTKGDEDMKIVWLSLYFYLCFCFGELLWVLNF